MDDGPVRIQLSRKKGFNLQIASMAVNGRGAVNVARPSGYGNPFRVEDCGSAEEAVRRFRAYIEGVIDEPSVRASIEKLRGFNLACWCGKGGPCHADALLEVANKPDPAP